MTNIAAYIKIKTVLRGCHKVTYDISPVSVDFICYWLSKVLLSSVSIEGPETEYLSLYSLSLIFR